MARRVSARRTLAVVAAVVALPYPLLVIWWAAGDENGVIVGIAVVVAAALAAAPFAARSPRFAALASGLWLLLLFLGFVSFGGFIMWPGAFLFLAAALPRPETSWRVAGLVAMVAGGVAVVGAVSLVDDARDDPDLEVRLQQGASFPAFSEQALDDPRVHAVSSGDPVDVELVEGLSPDMRSDTVATLRRSPDVLTVRVVD
jgi:hypothetical protein